MEDEGKREEGGRKEEDGDDEREGKREEGGGERLELRPGMRGEMMRKMRDDEEDE